MASNPYLLDRPAVVSFSGGRTSGYMLWHILQAFGGTLPDDVKVVFANTGKERPETLDFVERCSQRWGVPVVWLEYRYDAPVQCPTRRPDWAGLSDDDKTDAWTQWDLAMRQAGAVEEFEPESREATVWELGDDGWEDTGETTAVVTQQKAKLRGRHTFAQVDYTTASRDGEPLEEVIAVRNMLPNVVARFCTVECKIRTTDRYLRSLGWTEWENAIGFRSDEPRRVAKLNSTNRHSRENPVCPMFAAGVDKPAVLEWWRRQPFRLELEEWEGNCDLCFLKGAGKIRQVMRDDPTSAGWWIRMEAAAVRRGLARNPSVARFRKDRPPYRVQLELAQRPGLFDAHEPDELSIACHCTD